MTSMVSPPLPALTRVDLATHIAARLAGRMDNAQLATWAFDCLYTVELGSATIEVGAEELIADVLDQLMFSDDPHCALSEQELHTLAVRLQIP